MTSVFLIFGIVFSSLVVEFFSIIPGGLIVPAYLAIFYSEPLRIVGTFSVASITLVLMKFLSGRFLFEKKKKFIITIIISSLFTFFWWKAMPFIFPKGILFETAGWVIPGLLASCMDKHGYFKTLFYTLVVSGVLAALYFFFFIKLN